ncbi:RNA-binding domain superfamily [Babesia duncani]|uniref:RNA-binding domain superfamily n=1 Tax=Babesia duncani TaxID=323732 RepID=A0AAD9PK97_9APIC|nr:RNA-binding domain superfamily [Babesia duncani]
MHQLFERLKREKTQLQERSKQNEEAAKIYAEYLKSFGGHESDSNNIYPIGENEAAPAVGSADDKPSANYLSQFANTSSKTLASSTRREIDALSREFQEQWTTLESHWQQSLNCNRQNIPLLLKVHGLPLGTTPDHLVQELASYGPINVEMHLPDVATVSFENPYEVIKAQQRFGSEIVILNQKCPLEWCLEDFIIKDEALVRVPCNIVKRRVVDLMASYTAEVGFRSTFNF